MCSPTTTSGIGGAGVGLSALGMLSSANAAENNATSLKTNLQFQSDMASINARLAESNAQTALIQGQRQVQNSELKTASLKSTQRASMAANGIDLGSDTATNILTTTDVMGAIDANTLQSNAVANAWGYRTQSANFTADSMVKAASASGISPSSAFSTSLLGGAGNVATSWYTMTKGLGMSNGTT